MKPDHFTWLQSTAATLAISALLLGILALTGWVLA